VQSKILMTIQVTQEHINRGIRGDCGSCPIALAIQEALPKLGINVQVLHVLIQGEIVPLPSRARWFIADFDTNPRDEDADIKWLEPFDFELDYEEEE